MALDHPLPASQRFRSAMALDHPLPASQRFRSATALVSLLSEPMSCKRSRKFLPPLGNTQRPTGEKTRKSDLKTSTSLPPHANGVADHFQPFSLTTIDKRIAHFDH
jgi:hypothetical protein